MEKQHIAILDYFADFPDPRQLGKVLYPLQEIILTALCAVICGADSFVEMEEFGNSKIDFLKEFLPFDHGIPSHDTFGLIFASIDAKLFSSLFVEWVRSIQQNIPEIIAIDGKTLRRSKNGDQSPIHIVSAWATQQQLVLGQTKTNEKSNEITAIPELLSILSLKGAIVTIDAMGCQKNIATQIHKNQADYVLAVKENQPRLHEEIALLMQGYESQTIPLDGASCRTVDKDHGRIETRNYFITDRIDCLSCADKWPGLQSIGMVCAEREIDGVSTRHTRYFISTLPADAYLFAKAVRSHWGIENSLHWVMDIVFRDDECRVRKKNAPVNFATIKHITHNMLKSIPGKASMRVRRKRAGWDNDFLASALAANPAI